MAPTLVLSALVLLGCVSDSWQRCYSYHCAHHSLLSECVRGSYECRQDEFCETTTHVAHGNNPWVTTDCRPMEDLPDCLATMASNAGDCDPNDHSQVCHYCCLDSSCMTQLSQGVLPVGVTVPPATAQPATTGAGNTDSAGTAGAVGTTVTSAAATTGGSCLDLFLGDCTVDYAGRCGEPLIQQLCANSCGVCP